MRFVPYNKQLRNPDNDEFLGILNIAFRLRESDKGGMSLTWIEHYGAKCLDTYGVAAARFRDSLGEGKKLPGKGAFAIGQAGLCRQTAEVYGKQIRLVHAPDGPNTGHVEMHRFTDDDLLLLDALALDVFDEHVLVAQLDVPSR